ncbi:DNA polymerase-3 subunit delta' [Arcicella aurantiaca]|uniref:DNA polymerase-3 subunit delta n=1 Tax=Arcicella aurantiaca TaxID=591202 RepID=A0A316EGW8_9BACT|nr:DNA polymerase III subunit delta [Arcicella aurantiaca]PWK27987.1 DNA polymerase-3 subunit delta' [Arcicella aurantiaca]
MLFKDIPGLAALKNTLIHSVEANHVAHAQLFHGGVGSANLALAWAYSTYINCEDREVVSLGDPVDTDNGGDACGRCASCVKMAKMVHPDIHHIFPTPSAKETILELLPTWRKFLIESPYRSLTDWLEFTGVTGNKQGIIPIKEAHNIIEKISLKAFEAEYKILIIWQPELMNIESANSLLKILEEPPAKTLFILVCNDTNRLLTTILSRTQRIVIPSFTDEDTIKYLTEKEGIDTERAKQIAYLSEGNLSKAVELVNYEGEGKHQWFANWMRMAYKPDLATLVKLADEFDAFPKEYQKGMMEYGLNIFRDLLLWKNGAEALVRLEGEELTFVQNFSKAVKVNAIEQIVNELSQTYYYLERNGRAKILHLDLSLNIARLFKK